MRVTEGMLYSGATNSLNMTRSAIQRMTEKVSSGKTLNRPSDNPADARSAIQIHDSLSEIDQYLRNIDTAAGKVQAMDTALDSVGDLIQRANELAIAGANSTLGPSERQAMAAEVSQLIEALSQDAAAKYNDEFIFSGFRVDRPPYQVLSPGTLGTYQGDHGVTQARVGAASIMEISVAGDRVFQPAIDALTQLNNELAAGQPVQGTTITQIGAALQTVLETRASIGARANRLEQAKSSQESVKTTNQGLLSNLEDSDMASVITELTKRQTTYQATLAVTAKVIQTSLIDYLR
jgi:flagellar hook-associated protein 3 FlgL